MKNRSIKKIGILLLALALVLAVCPAAILAEDVTCPCCEAVAEWTEVNATTENPFAGGGHYRLTETIHLQDAAVMVTEETTIDLNGFTIYAPENDRAFTLATGGKLNILDQTEEGLGSIIANELPAEKGGVLYLNSESVLNLYSGRLVGTSVTGSGGTVLMASKSEMNMYGGVVVGGTVTGKSGAGGNIYNNGTLNLYEGSIIGGACTGTNGYGGNLYVVGTLNMYGGVIEDGVTYAHGGNMFVGNSAKANIYGGIIQNGVCPKFAAADGTFKSGNGANVYVTGPDSKLRIYGGLITGGEIEANNNYGGNLMINTGAHVYIYGGTIENGSANKGGNICVGSSKTLSDGSVQYSSVFILGGTITATANDKNDIYKRATKNAVQFYNGYYNGIKNVTTYRPDCGCYIKTETGYTFWHAGDCTDCLFAKATEKISEVVEGYHNYRRIDAGTYACEHCDEVYSGENVVVCLDGRLYEDVQTAFQNVKSGSNFQLLADTRLEDLAVVDYTLDLNGYTLEAQHFTSATSGNVIDTSAGTVGKLNCGDVTLSDDNTYIPLTFEDGIRFCPVDFTQWVETVDEKTTKIKFYFTQRAAETLIDDAVKAGNRELDVQITLSWKDSKGKTQTKTVSLGKELLKKYVVRWDSRVFVATVRATDISNLTATWTITSTATSGTTVASEKIASSGYIRENLSWDQINSYPLKRSDMTEQEMRDAVVEFMYFTKTYLWTPSVSVSYDRNASGSDDKMSQGTIYGGLPYVGVASGNVYRMMDYINEYGVLDMEKALPALGTKDHLVMSDLKYFGSQCSISVYWAWGRIMNSANYLWTYNTVPNNGFITLGDMQIPDIDKWTAAYNTTICCHENGEEVMYNTYAQAKKADVLVYYIQTSGGDGAGHLMMLYEDAHVVYNEDGTINGEKSYLTIIDQGQSWKSKTNASGDSFRHKGNIGLKKYFKDMYDYGYIPFTLAEYLGLDPVEETTVGLVNGETTYIDGVISETDRSYNTSATTQALNWTELMESTVVSNYGIADAYIIIYNEAGEEIYRHAVRTGQAGNKNLSFETSGAMVTTWGEMPAEGTYQAEIVIQLATGERPTIFNGQLTMSAGV